MRKNRMKLSKQRKGAMSLGDAPAAVTILIVISVFLAVGALIVTSIQDQTDAGSVAEDVTNSSLNALLDFGNFQGIIAIAIVAAIVLGLIAFLRT